jgi:hypothetical protein
VKFEWDAEKNRENIRKHGIDFADVPEIFSPSMQYDIDDREDYGETRWVGTGMLRNIIVVVVFTERAADIIRIISARRANSREQKRYVENI